MEIKQELIKTLEKTNLFTNIYIYGCLDSENRLSVEYKQNPNISTRHFIKEKDILGKKIEELISNNYPYLTKICFGPNENGISTTSLECLILEKGRGLTEQLINSINTKIIRSYLFLKGVK